MADSARKEPLSENERELALKSWASGDANAPKWGRLVLEAYDGLLATLEEVRQIASHPGFATGSGEPIHALDAISEILERGENG
jgi:hypothetical protein